MGAACTLCGGPGKLSAASPAGDEDQWWDYASSSSDEECLVPPIPVGSDDGTVLFYWAGETPRAPREPVGFQPGQYLKYNKTGEKVMVVTNHHDDVQPYYTIRMQDDGIRQTVCEHLSPWDENGVECPKRVNSFVDTAAVGAVNHTAGSAVLTFSSHADPTTEEGDHPASRLVTKCMLQGWDYQLWQAAQSMKTRQ